MPEKSTPSDMALPLLLEENLRLHAIGAEIFAPFVIERLGGGNEITSAELTVILTDAEGQEQTKGVHLVWKPQSASLKPLAVQERVKTEWGAGIACALIPSLLGLRVLSVALEGERFDYRIGTEDEEWGLEVSGTLSESSDELRERHRLKTRQLQQNPARLNGYVVVVGFTRREVLISLHSPF